MSHPTTPMPGAAPAYPTGHMPAMPLPPVKTGPRPAVIIWGAIIVLIGAWIVLASVGLVFSGELALIVILGVGGLTLVASAAIAAARRPKG